MTGPWIVAMVALWVVVLLSLVLQLGQFRRVADMLERVEARLRMGGLDSPVSMGLPPGTPVPRVAGHDATGSFFEFGGVAETRAIYLFLSSECDPCQELISDLKRHLGWTRSDTALIAIAESAGLGLESLAGVRAVLDEEQAIASAFGTSATPHAFLVDEAGTIVEKSIPNSVEHLEALAIVQSSTLKHGGSGGR